ncbi:MAG: glycine cleavage system protein [Clostridia bacterium]|jgi:glycine cleavage system H protein|nr:gcvH [Clostridiales bacterium]MDK2985563.1 glycine cleavage system protein [Clostridia bacterium]
MYPENLKYTKDHEWVKIEGDKVKIGITYHAQDALGDVVFVELPEVDDEFEAGESFGTVESVKAVSDCYAPVSGKITAINEDILDSPELVNSSPYDDGWFIEMEVTDSSELDQLMNSEEYQKYLEEEE